MKKYLWICLCTLALITACAAPPRETVTDDPGPYPENYHEIILCYLTTTLRNPESIKDFEILKSPEIVTLETYYAYIPLHEGQEVYEVFVVFDVKDTTGKYTGRDMHAVWIRHNRIVAYDYLELDLDFRLRQRRHKTCDTRR